MDVPTLLRAGARVLTEAGVPSPETDVSALLAHAWDIDASTLARRRLFAEEVPAAVATRFARLLDERSRRIPLQHLTGVAHFRRLELLVGPGVFVPRPETELLVTEVLDHLSRRETAADPNTAPLVVDLCSGSGAIALSVALERPGTRVIGIEREAGALRWSRTNLARLDLGASDVDLIAGDATTAAADHPELVGTVDVVVTNPPYVPDAAVPKDPEVRDHDPAAALYGGVSGLEIPALILAQAARLLRPGGLVIMEHAEDQGAGVREIIAGVAGLAAATTFPDYTGRDRYTVAAATDPRTHPTS
ncbi:peptide chain release factor N(5)-glutamine methyltransferase [Brevibacterium sp. 2SA]|uniref:peptide chain release factor N(5)-glutamine methyltransferase n=1 Tax=Brevibacterium sp. 2SA TaxID=2502198 RepID=UPI0010F4BE11|nr:peptide chain release factor N(5)-glutamine methyltransferase [Brevibacterium sp. 2SA]